MVKQNTLYIIDFSLSELFTTETLVMSDSKQWNRTCA